MAVSLRNSPWSSAPEERFEKAGYNDGPRRAAAPRPGPRGRRRGEGAARTVGRGGRRKKTRVTKAAAVAMSASHKAPAGVAAVTEKAGLRLALI